MRTWAFTVIAAFIAVAGTLQAQETGTLRIPKATAVEPPTTSTVVRTNSMAVLDDKTRLGPNDYVSFRVVEDRDNESQRFRVNDSGELEIPLIGLVAASGHTCKEVANSVKAALEREYYRHATVIIAVDRLSEKSRGKVYVYGFVKNQGPQEIPPDETYTVSKAIIQAGGFGDFGDQKKVKLTRKNGERVVVNLKRVIEDGRVDEDVVVRPDDKIYVPQRLVKF
jgi:polysaccharide biosynthesis/export protein